MAGTAGGVLGIMEQIINNSGFESIIPRAPTDAAAGWLIFMAVVIMLFEIFFIAQRFINIKAINDHITIVIIVVSKVKFNTYLFMHNVPLVII